MVKIVDPGSVYITRDITSETNILSCLTRKATGDLYTVNEGYLTEMCIKVGMIVLRSRCSVV